MASFHPHPFREELRGPFSPSFSVRPSLLLCHCRPFACCVVCENGTWSRPSCPLPPPSAPPLSALFSSFKPTGGVEAFFAFFLLSLMSVATVLVLASKGRGCHILKGTWPHCYLPRWRCAYVRSICDVPKGCTLPHGTNVQCNFFLLSLAEWWTLRILFAPSHFFAIAHPKDVAPTFFLTAEI